MKIGRFMAPLALALFALSAWVACSSGGQVSVVPSPPHESPTSKSAVRPHYYCTGSPQCIKHVVIVIQENRSFDNIFGGDGMYQTPFPGANGATYGLNSAGAQVTLHPVPLATNADISHCAQDAWTAYDGGKMDAFNHEKWQGTCPSASNNVAANPYAYVSNGFTGVGPYWTMAKHWVLADNYFPTQMGPSFTAHQNLIASTTEIDDSQDALVNFPGYWDPSNQVMGITTPWGCDSPAQSIVATVTTGHVISPPNPNPTSTPCIADTEYHTMADTLDAKGVSWKYYAPNPKNGSIWSAFDAIRKVRYGTDWTTKVKSPETTILSDIANGKLASVSWVVPNGVWSDHAGSGGQPNTNEGPSWVAAVVNAIGQSNYWDTTAIIVVWDDWGGWYDHVNPPHLDFRGLGIRTPMMIISSYSKKGYVSHTQYESGSILRFVETVFGLPTLGGGSSCLYGYYYGTRGYTDCRGANLTDSFNFSAGPRAFGTPISAPYPPSTFANYYATYGAELAPDNE